MNFIAKIFKGGRRVATKTGFNTPSAAENAGKKATEELGADEYQVEPRPIIPRPGGGMTLSPVSMHQQSTND